jgi:hypothetical protein
MLAMCDRHGRVWASIPGLANRSQVSIEMVEAALSKFLSPDQYSRTADNEGRRIEVIDGGWRLLNHEKYRALRDAEERKTYQRDWVNKKRAKKSVDQIVDKKVKCRPQSTYTDTDTDTDIKHRGKKKRFSPPSVDEIKLYCKERKNNINPENFKDFYESKGWMIGKNKMKNWKAAIRTWEKNSKDNEPDDFMSRVILQ